MQSGGVAFFFERRNPLTAKDTKYYTKDTKSYISMF
jgi:hypothetical protein